MAEAMAEQQETSPSTTSPSTTVLQDDTSETNDRNGPWYELRGPNAAYVRKHQFLCITQHYNIEDPNKFPFHHRILKNTLEAFLPDCMSDFGTYRGFATFGLDTSLQKIIIQAYVEHMGLYEHSMRILREKFTPYLTHYLYKPDGKRFAALETNFNTVATKAAVAPPTPPTPTPTPSDNVI